LTPPCTNLDEALKKKKKRNKKRNKKKTDSLNPVPSGQGTTNEQNFHPNNDNLSSGGEETSLQPDEETDDETFENSLRLFEQRLIQQHGAWRQRKLKPNIDQEWLNRIRNSSSTIAEPESHS
jgi:hypothetical protein